jgi:hypothetical protein
MTRAKRNHVTDLRGVSRMAIDATSSLVDLVEALQTRIALTPAKVGGPLVEGAVRGLTSLVYGTIRGVTCAMGSGIDDPRFDLGLPPAQQWVAHETSHLDLLRRPAVYQHIRAWLAA